MFSVQIYELLLVLFALSYSKNLQISKLDIDSTDQTNYLLFYFNKFLAKEFP